MAIIESAFNVFGQSGYDKIYFETSTNSVIDTSQNINLTQILTNINNRATTNENRVNNNASQLEYQLPIVVGNQLRLTKSSNSNRYFIRITSNLTGNLTISTDSGATSKPLRNVDSTQVTSLEQGFFEIVEDTSFFTLRNRGGVSQADLQALITAANEVEANSNAVRQQLITTINATESNINLPNNSTFLQAINQIPNIGSQKRRTASGTVSSSDGTLPFTVRGSGQNVFLRYITINNIGFNPSYIKLISNTEDENYYTDYVASQSNVSNLIVLSYSDSTNSSYNNTSIILSGNAYVNGTSTRLPVGAPNVEYTWVAYE